MPEPLRLAFLGCGFITRVHSRHLRSLGGDDRLPATPAATGTRPTAYCRALSAASRSYGDYAAAIDDPRVDAVVVAVPPRFHLDLTLRALAAGKHVLVEKPAFLAHGGLPSGARRRATRPGASCSSARTITTSRWRSGCARLLADGVDRRDGVRALHDDRPAAEDRRRLAQRRGDGRRRRVLRGRHPLAAPRRQPRARASSTIQRLPAVGVARRARPARQEHDGGVPLRQRRGRLAVLLARDSVAASAACGCRSCSAATASSRSSRTALFVVVARAGACRG